MYDHKSVEARWQGFWRQRREFEAEVSSRKPKYYVLEMFPYPTGGMHLGHIRNYTAGDALARFKRARGYNILHPMGWDAFGLPAETAALRRHTQPALWAYANVTYLKRQFGRMGWLYDWRREIVTCAPEYYCWEQLLFIEMFKRGLAYRRSAAVPWCAHCQTSLAAEQSAHGCWRCGATPEIKERPHWFFKVEPFAKDLLEGLSELAQWPRPVVTMQRDWIENRLHDWAVSRERAWGAPIPIVYCEACGPVPVPEKDLPVLLPDEVEGASLAKLDGFVKARCPTCAGAARRETLTLDTLVDSSWYYARFCSLPTARRAFSPEEARYWLPVDQYTGGGEHATMHLLYIRYMHRVLQAIGWLPREVGREPVTRLLTQGLVLKGGKRLAATGRARRRKTLFASPPVAVDPEALLDKFGADALRLYSLFAAPTEKDLEWTDEGLAGMSRFLARVHFLVHDNASLVHGLSSYDGAHDTLTSGDARRLRAYAHQIVNRVTADLDAGPKFNTAISSIMELVNETQHFRIELHDWLGRRVLRETLEAIVRLLAPFAPHLAEELWRDLGYTEGLEASCWPIADAQALSLDVVPIVVQINGKRRASLMLSSSLEGEELEQAVLKNAQARRYLEGGKITQTIVVPGRLVNFVME